MSARKAQHGTRSKYVLGCRCDQCKHANRVYTRTYWRDHRRHIEGVPHTDAAPVRAHITKLRNAGMGLRRIAAASGVPMSTLTHVVYDNRSHVRPHTARAVLAVQHPDPYLVDATGARRRVQALARLGWTQEHIADAAGVGHHIIWALMAGKNTRTTRANADAVARAYDALSMRRGPSTVAANRAASRGWAPPLAWDDPDADTAPKGVAA